METRLTLWKKILFSAISLLLFYSLFEAIVRISVDSPPYQRSNDEVGVELIPGYAEYDAAGKEKMRINSLGFRGRELAEEKPEGTIRIFALGDSTTFGLRPEGCPYPAQLEGLFSRSSHAIEVVNAGVEGNSSDRALARLTKRIVPLKPDIVLIAIGWNDLYATNPRAPANVGAYRSAAEVLNRSYVFKAMRKVYFQWIKTRIASKDASADTYDDFRPVHFEQNLEAIISAAEDGAAVPVLMTLPTVLSDTISAEALKIVHYPYFTNSTKALKKLAAIYNDSIRRFARERSVMLIDNASYFDSLQKKEQYFFDTVHVYCDGNGALAQNIFNELIKSGRIKRKP